MSLTKPKMDLDTPNAFYFLTLSCALCDVQLLFVLNIFLITLIIAIISKLVEINVIIIDCRLTTSIKNDRLPKNGSAIWYIAVNIRYDWFLSLKIENAKSAILVARINLIWKGYKLVNNWKDIMVNWKQFIIGVCLVCKYCCIIFKNIFNSFLFYTNRNAGHVHQSVTRTIAYSAPQYRKPSKKANYYD